MNQNNYRYNDQPGNSPSEIVEKVGDEENDCPMIEAAGVGVAMANASQVAKDMADYVTVSDNNHSGITEVIEKFVLAC